jgi:hypothetical protein
MEQFISVGKTSQHDLLCWNPWKIHPANCRGSHQLELRSQINIHTEFFFFFKKKKNRFGSGQLGCNWKKHQTHIYQI